MPTDVTITREGALATLELASADGLHVLSRETLSRLKEAVDALAIAPDVHALVLRGGGTRAFSAGADLRELAGLEAEAARAYAEFGQGVTQAVARFPVPTIAALNGPAYGGGIELALACDFRLAGSESLLHYQAARLGLLPGWGGTQRLPQLVGRPRAKAMMLLGQPVPPALAREWGLIDDFGPDLDALLRTWTARVADTERPALIQIKRAIDLAAHGDYAGEREAFAACFQAGRPQALIKDWLEKSPASARNR